MPAKPLNEKTKKAQRDKARALALPTASWLRSIVVVKAHTCLAAPVTSLWPLGLWVGSTAICQAKEALVRPILTFTKNLVGGSDGNFR